MEAAQGTRRTHRSLWAVRESFLEVVVVCAETCQSQRSVRAEARFVLVTALSLVRNHHTQ